MILEYLILLVAFLAITAISWVVLNLVTSHIQAQKMRDASLTEYELEQKKSFLAQVKPMLQSVVKFNRQFPPTQGWIEESRHKYELSLLRAGSPGKLTGEEFLALKQLAPIHLLVLLLVCQVSNPAIVIILVWFSYFLPDLWLNDLVRDRTNRIVRGLPDALDTFTLMVQAGQDFGQAIDTYIRTSEPGPLVSEFGLTRNQMRLGMSRTEALDAMAARINCSPLTNFTTAVIQSERTGTSVAEVLNAQGMELRNRRFQVAEEMGQKATIKMLAPLLLLILPNVFIVLFAPMALKFFTE
jgi:tight adherence protein C